ncbi:MAG: response regulator, partial [Acetobacteraceae bacterium]|nr:response regulator [Acetobacteraceae bacterium]
MDALARLTGGVAHEFNNLLTVVLGNAAALRAGAEAKGDVSAAKRAEMIERAAEHGGRLANQLLAFSRQQILRPETISPYEVMSAMHDVLARAAGDVVRIRLTEEPAVWKCRADPNHLRSALLNLVLNARDAMPAGGDITLSCRNHAQAITTQGRTAGDYVRISVTDTGTGISPDLLDKVFEPFFTTKPIGKGSGLGLAQVHGFAGQSGGWVELVSTVGKGTTVSLLLPRAAEDAKGAGAHADHPGDTAMTGIEQTILLVEPDDDLRTTTSEILEFSGYRVLAAANASGGLAHLSSDTDIDVLLTDVELPGEVSGIGLARDACRIRPGLATLLTTSAGGDAARQESKVIPDCEVLEKPYHTSELLRTVETLAKRAMLSIEADRLFAETEEAASEHENWANRARAAERRIPGSRRRTTAVRLGVMPFKAIGSSGYSDFSLGLAEEMTSAFSRFRCITCVAPTSVAAAIDKSFGQSERWRALDLDFLVDGSLRRDDDNVRIVVRVLDMRGSGEMSWSRHLQSRMSDILALQDEVASKVAAQVVPEVLLWESEKTAVRPKVDATAYDLMVRAIPAIYRLDKNTFKSARPMLEMAIEKDPSSGSARSWLAHWYLFAVGQGWADDPVLAIQRADALAQRAVVLAPSD